MNGPIAPIIYPIAWVIADQELASIGDEALSMGNNKVSETRPPLPIPKHILEMIGVTFVKLNRDNPIIILSVSIVIQNLLLGTALNRLGNKRVAGNWAIIAIVPTTPPNSVVPPFSTTIAGSHAAKQ